MEKIEQIKQSTKVLGLVINEVVEPITKLEAVLALTKNLEILKSELNAADYAEFKEIEENVNKIINKLTEPKFLNSITKGFESFFKSL